MITCKCFCSFYLLLVPIPLFSIDKDNPVNLITMLCMTYGTDRFPVNDIIHWSSSDQRLALMGYSQHFLLWAAVDQTHLKTIDRKWIINRIYLWSLSMLFVFCWFSYRFFKHHICHWTKLSFSVDFNKGLPNIKCNQTNQSDLLFSFSSINSSPMSSRSNTQCVLSG